MNIVELYLTEENKLISKSKCIPPSNHAHYSFSYRWIVINVLKFGMKECLNFHHGIICKNMA